MVNGIREYMNVGEVDLATHNDEARLLQFVDVDNEVLRGINAHAHPTFSSRASRFSTSRNRPCREKESGLRDDVAMTMYPTIGWG